MRRTMLALFTAMAFAPAAHAAVTLDFNEFRSPKGTRTYLKAPYAKDGFRISASNPQGGYHFISTQYGRSGLDSAPNALGNYVGQGGALVNYGGSSTSRLTYNDGQAFRINEIEVAHNNGNAYGLNPFDWYTVVFTFDFADGTSKVEERTLSNAAGNWLNATTLEFDEAPLVAFSWKPGKNSSGFLQFDNIVLNSNAAVPEPATWALLIAGFGLTGTTLRRRRALAA